MAANVFKRLAREQKTLESDVAVAAVLDQRVYQCVDDQIVFAITGSKEVAAIVKVNLNALVLVRMIRMERSSQTVDRGINFHGVNVFRAPLHGPADIIS